MQSLSEDERREVLTLARQALCQAVSRQSVRQEIPKSAALAEPRAVFVSLHVGKKLRGCMGTLDAHAPLAENLVKCAADAGLHDPRFPQMREDEVGGVTIEVSVLSPLQPIRPEQIEIGRHGLLVARGKRRGLLLPQVATEHGLSVERFLQETSIKAGLPRDAWMEPDTEIYGFECEIVAEESGERNQTNLRG
jgi:AmmeMemoRadiSam system protein A